MNNNWRIVTDDDGKQYIEVDAQVMVPPELDNSNPEGKSFLRIAPPGYIIDSLFTMRNRAWNDANPGFASGGMIGPSSAPWMFDTRAASDAALLMRANTWLPGDEIEKPEPPLPAGRFQNLEWDES